MNKIGVGSLAATVLLILFLLVAGVCACITSYYIYYIGGLGANGVLLNAHSLTTTMAVLAIVLALSLLLVFFTVAGARNFDFVDETSAKGWGNVEKWTTAVRKDFTELIIKTEKARHLFIFFSIITGAILFFSFTALLAFAWSYLTLGQSGASGPTYDSARLWSLISGAAFLILLLMTGLALFFYIKGAGGAKKGEKGMEAGYESRFSR